MINKVKETSEAFPNIVLFKEGNFWKAYQQSAYLFSKHIADYRVKKKYVKTIGDTLYSLGFPVSATDKVLSGHGYEQVNEKKIIVALNGDATAVSDEYSVWKESIQDETDVKDSVKDSEKADMKVDVKAEDAIGEIRRFPIESSTPIECMCFVARLKRILNG